MVEGRRTDDDRAGGMECPRRHVIGPCAAGSRPPHCRFVSCFFFNIALISNIRHPEQTCSAILGPRESLDNRQCGLDVQQSDISPSNSTMEDDDDVPRLPADTLALLQEFNAEKDARTKHFEDLKTSAEEDFQAKLSMDAFTEDWNASQFWYNESTARALAQQLLDGADSNTSIAIVSAPSVYVALRNLLAEQEQSVPKPPIKLLEFDKRFEIVGADFVPYDFWQPLKLPPMLRGAFDRIICDPPFLSDDCQAKTALTVRFLAKDWSQEGLRLISCTGERMGAMMERLYGRMGMKETDFDVVHAKGLSNEFRCYANFECGAWSWK